MKMHSAVAALLLSTLCLAASPLGAAAQAVPEKLETPVVGGTLAVVVTDSQGNPAEAFSRSSLPTLDINFTLALSATGTYPLSFTVIQEGGGGKTETAAWSGTLEEGYYRLRYPLGESPASGGDVAVKVVMKVRMFTRKYSGESTYQYFTWEGSYRLGKR